MPTSSFIGRGALAAGLAAATLAWGAAAQAAVTYDFRWYADDDPDAAVIGSFRLTLPDFATAGVDIVSADLDACTIDRSRSSCGTQTLDPDGAAYGEADYDVVVFRYDQQSASRLRPFVFYFEDGALRTPGVYDDPISDQIARLTVTQVSAAPEPSTWALMIAGFGLAGVGLRRRQRLCAA